jgi:hypothetical protein
MSYFLRRVCFSALAVALAHVSFGGTLQDREKDITERSNEKKDDSNPPKYDSDTAFGSGTYPSTPSGSSGFLSDFWGWLVLAPFSYRHDDPMASMSPDREGWANESGSIFPPHAKGMATVPYARFDYNYQFVDGDLPIDTHDGRMELGYKFFAFQARMTKYMQSDGFTLDLRQYYGVLRYGGYRPDFLPGTFEFSIGLGLAHHAGDVEDDTSGAITIPLKYYPTEWLGVEFRPAWYRWKEIAVGDYDLSASLGPRYVQLRGGYRWFWDNGVVGVQSGPYAGVSLSF